MPTHRETFTIGLVVPIQGPGGIFGPSCELCAQLAVEEVNAGGDVFGPELRLRTVDGGAPPVRVTDQIDRLMLISAAPASPRLEKAASSTWAAGLNCSKR